ncbi:MAG: hypothetical protein KME06_18120 [Kastovskya adunca ATA6-11-RM4]|jgi:ATP-binding cassette subfamily B protein|nr:hypothetical protein [Kastovskya adunca ATA6-11-RM4]
MLSLDFGERFFNSSFLNDVNLCFTSQHPYLNLAEHFRGRTVFFITHRLGTIRHADAIVVMDRGSVVEQGTHEELMELRGRYYCLYIQQEAQVS